MKLLPDLGLEETTSREFTGCEGRGAMGVCTDLRGAIGGGNRGAIYIGGNRVAIEGRGEGIMGPYERAIWGPYESHMGAIGVCTDHFNPRLQKYSKMTMALT